MKPFFFLRLAAVCSAVAFPLVACSSGGNTVTGVGEDSGTQSSSGSPEKLDGATSSDGSAVETCEVCGSLEIVECKSGDFVGLTGCMKNGACKKSTFEEACRGPNTGGVYDYNACTQDFECTKSSPSISCECKSGQDYEANLKCAGGYCSAAAEDACPSACKSNSGWVGCQQAFDCRPIVCDCADGYRPVPWTKECVGGTCLPAPSVCPAACSGHGGWQSTGTSDAGVKDSGSVGSGNPGDPCNSGSECQPFNCGCNDGSSFNGSRSCQSKKCATKANTCNIACLSSGGWNGQ